MEYDNRFMNEVFRIVSGALRLDLDKVRAYTAFLADKLEAAGDPESAKRLRKLLEGGGLQIRPMDASVSLEATPSPVDYWARLNSYQPKALTPAQARALHEDNRGER